MFYTDNLKNFIVARSRNYIGKKLSWIINERWFWVIVIALVSILIIPFFIAMFILILPPDLRLVMTLLLVVGWGIAAGYKDWVLSKRKEEKKKQPSEK